MGSLFSGRRSYSCSWANPRETGIWLGKNYSCLFLVFVHIRINLSQVKIDVSEGRFYPRFYGTFSISLMLGKIHAQIFIFVQKHFHFVMALIYYPRTWVRLMFWLTVSVWCSDVFFVWVVSLLAGDRPMSPQFQKAHRPPLLPITDLFP